MRKTGFARYMIRRLPVGFAASPFEFVFMLTYALTSGHYLLDIILGRRDIIPLAALPLKGDTLNAWLVILFVSATVTCIGLLVNGYRPIGGLRLERSGLCGAGSMIAVYLFELYSVIGFSFNIGFITIVGLLVATLYKVALIGQALDTLTERKGSSPQ